MKVEFKKTYGISSLLGAILFFILGAVLFNNPGIMVIIVSWTLGGIVALYGLYKCIKNYADVKKDNNTPASDMIIGLTCVFIGLIFILLANVIEALIRFAIGGWILFCGINRLINSMNLNKKTKKFYIMLIIAIILILCGCYTILVSNLPFQTIGLVLMAYSVVEIIGYIISKLMPDNNALVKYEVKEEVVPEVKVEKKPRGKVKEAKIVSEKKDKKKKSSK